MAAQSARRGGTGHARRTKRADCPQSARAAHKPSKRASSATEPPAAAAAAAAAQTRRRADAQTQRMFAAAERAPQRHNPGIG